MTQIGELFDKARDCLARARIILAAGVGEVPAAMPTWRDFLRRGRSSVRAPGEPPRRTVAYIVRWRGASRSLPTSPCFYRKPTT